MAHRRDGVFRAMRAVRPVRIKVGRSNKEVLR